MAAPIQIPNVVSPHGVYLSRVFIGVSSSLLVLSTITLGVRLSKQIRRDGNFGWDTMTVIFGYVGALLAATTIEKPLMLGMSSFSQRLLWH